jgi:CheY-like chemotaxis protein/HPt (histidine-containing phosphotransfer) domain-containing protein
MDALEGKKGGGSKDRSENQWKVKPIETIRGAHVLLVEDNKINQQVAWEFLTRAGLKTTIANNGREAVTHLKKEHFDAVLMDIQMPEMDGYEASGIIRNDLGFSELPIIAMTANAMASDREKCLNAGMNDHLAKPIDPDRFFAALLKWIPARESTAEPMDIELPSVASSREMFTDNLPGIDIEVGIKRVGGNHALYQKLLLDFYQDHQKDGQSIQKALSKEDVNLAQRIAHTIKGVSGYIGAAELQKDAEKLESTLKEGTLPTDDNLLIAFNQSLDRVMGSLKEMALASKPEEETKPAPQTEPIDQKTILPLIDGLYDQLGKMDPGAEKTAAGLYGKMGNDLQRKLMKKIQKQIDDFEYDVAQEILGNLRNQF